MKTICVALGLLLMSAVQQVGAIEDAPLPTKSECENALEKCREISLKVSASKNVVPLHSDCEDCKKKCNRTTQELCAKASKDKPNFESLKAHTLNCVNTCPKVP